MNKLEHGQASVAMKNGQVKRVRYEVLLNDLEVAALVFKAAQNKRLESKSGAIMVRLKLIE